MKLEFKNIIYNSKDYWQSVDLRSKILREPLGQKFSQEELDNESDQFHFLGFNNSKIVGCFIFINQSESTLKMRQVCIDDIFQGQGLGFEMMLFAEKWAIENGYNQIYCHARDNALAFYKKLDYQKEGNSFKEVGLKHYKLVKFI